MGTSLWLTQFLQASPPPPPHITRALTAVHNLSQVRKNPRRRLLNMLPCFVHHPPSFLYGSTPGLACVAGGIVGFRAHKQKRRSRDSERRSRDKPLAAAPLVCRGFAARCRGFAACLCALNPTIPPATQATPGLVELVPVTSGALIHTSGRTH